MVFGFGGNFGDCAAYRGRLVAVPEAGGKPADFTVDAAAGESQGAIWMGGAAPAVDRRGHLWVSVGNGSVYSGRHPYDDSDSALELSPSLRLLQFFAPRTWASDNRQDLDMSTVPVLLSDGQVLLAGKSRIVYLLNGARPGGIGGEQAALGPVCGSDIDGGAAAVGTTAYLPCLSGIIAVRATRSPAALRLLWSSGTGGGPPDRGRGPGLDHRAQRHALRARSRHRPGAAAGADRRARRCFPTPSVGDGLLLLAASARRTLSPSPRRPGPARGPACRLPQGR